jgi:hypothetical protein
MLCRQLHALACTGDSGPLEQGPKMLFDGARTDAQLAGNFLVAAALQQQLQNLSITFRNFESG